MNVRSPDATHVDDVVAANRKRLQNVSVVDTGRDAPPELIELADTVTEMRKSKHGYQSGVAAKRGLDY